MMKPNYDQWAEALLQEIYYAPEEHRLSVVKEHLLKATQRGYRDAVVNDWWRHQDAAKQLSDQQGNMCANPFYNGDLK